MHSPSTFLGDRPQTEILGDIGTVLLRIKCDRGLTLDDMGAKIGVSREMVSQYIAGEAEMGMVKWLRARVAWPELAERLEETAAERLARSKQQPLDLPLPRQRERAA